MTVFQCTHCGNQMYALHSSGVPMICCGEPMNELSAGSSDGAAEKHVPAVIDKGDVIQVTVGEVPHPMIPEHSIQWIGVEQGDKVQFAYLHPGTPPTAVFSVEKDVPYTVYEYCNLHGLWKA